MSHTSPNYADWRSLSAIKIWEVAALMHGIDPLEMDSAMVVDPDDPTGINGIPLDTSWEQRMLLSAVKTQDVLSAPLNVTAPDVDTEVSRVSLVPWLRARGYSELADELDVPESVSNISTNTVIPQVSTWRLNKSQRVRGYGPPLYRVLETAHNAGQKRPTARDVINAFRTKQPDEIAKVLPNGFDYYDAKEGSKPASIKAISEAIRRMTK